MFTLSSSEVKVRVDLVPAVMLRIPCLATIAVDKLSARSRNLMFACRICGES